MNDRGVGFRFTTRAGPPDLRRPPVGAAAGRVGHRPPGGAGPGHLAPRGPVRRLRPRPLRAEGAARPAGGAASTGCCARSTSGSCRWSRRSASPAGARPRRASRSTTCSSPTTSAYSLPYRALFGQASLADLWDPLLDALAQLLARAHLAGFFWGDCSLSNTLFRRDAGALAAWLVDAETGELHDRLSDGQRDHDLTIAEMNVAGELLDIMAAVADVGRRHPARRRPPHRPRGGGRGPAPPLRRPVARADHRRGVRGGGGVARRRAGPPPQRARASTSTRWSWWTTRADPDGHVLRLTTRVVEPGHHRRRLLQLTGLDVQENQARRLLNDILAYRAWLERRGGVPVDEQVARPALDGRRVRADARPRSPPSCAASSRTPRSSTRSSSTGGSCPRRRARTSATEAAIADYLAEVLPSAADERTVLVQPPTGEIPIVGP